MSQPRPLAQHQISCFETLVKKSDRSLGGNAGLPVPGDCSPPAHCFAPFVKNKHGKTRIGPRAASQKQILPNLAGWSCRRKKQLPITPITARRRGLGKKKPDQGKERIIHCNGFRLFPLADCAAWCLTQTANSLAWFVAGFLFPMLPCV